MKAVQLQKQKEKSIETRLDEIKTLLEELMLELKENPPESNIKKNIIKKLEKISEEITSGKRKTIKFRDIKELDKIISSYGS